MLSAQTMSLCGLVIICVVVVSMSISASVMAINPKVFYHSAIWLAKRSEILKRDNNECQKCKRKGRYSKAACVHHIKHLKDREDLALVDDNLTSLCNTCHQYEHPEKFFNKVIKKIITNERW